MRRQVAVLLSAVLALSSGAAMAAEPAPRIVNGDPVANGDAPWMVDLRLFHAPHCGGTLVRPDWVLTAGHCVTDGADAVRDADDFTLAVGREDRAATTDGEDFDVLEIVRHPDYVDATLSHDVALLRLDGASTATPMPLAAADDVGVAPPGTAATVMGYGRTEHGSSSNVLLATEVEITTNDTCDAADQDDVICAGVLEDNGGRPPANDSCGGDSGGPLTVDDASLGLLQVGVVSYGPGNCGYTSPTLDSAGYARLTHVADWIDGVTDPGPPTAAFADDEITVVEGAPITAEVTLTVPAVGGEQVTVTVATTSGPSSLATTSETVTFDPGATSVDATFATTADGVHEPSSAHTLALDSTDVEVADTTLAVTVRDDAPPTLTLPDTDLAEADTDVTRTVTFLLDAPAVAGDQFGFATFDDTASHGTDILPVDVVVTFAPGATTATVDIVVVGDDIAEDDERIGLRLGPVEGVAVGAIGHVTITDDDDPTEPDDDPTEPDDDPTDPTDDPTDPTDDPSDAVGVVRRAGEDRIGTALALTADRPDGGDDLVYLASATSFPDALVATPLAHRDDAPLLLTGSEDLDPRVLIEIVRLLSPVGHVVVLGGPVALSTAVSGALAANDLAHGRLAGADRFATATLVADRLGSVTRVLLATGRDFPDALAAGPAAAAIGGAILLTDGDAIPPATATWLATSNAPVSAIGGAAALAAPDAEALVGADRHATAVLVADRFLPDADVVGIASSADFPDAIAGGPVLAALGGALLLTPPDVLAEVTRDQLLRRRPSHVILLGGTSAISVDVERQVSS